MLQDNLKRADLLLILLYAAVLAIIVLRVNAEGTGYLSPDSKHYLNLAQNLKDGHGFYVLDEANTRTYFSIWPVGYPVLIYLFSELSTLDVYWSSKLLNFILLALGFVLLRQFSHPYAFILASVYGAYTFMEVYSFTWSEAPFLFLILLLAGITDTIIRGQHTGKNIAFLFVVCACLFLIRYIGAFSFAVPALLGLYFAFKGKKKTAIYLIISTVVLLALAIAYLYNNYRLSGFTTGFDRLEDETESLGAFLAMLFKALLNEFLIIREYRPQNQPDYLLYITAVIQIAVLAFVAAKVKRHFNFWRELKQNSFSMICIGIAFLYLAAILALRSISHFDELDYRLLAPFSFPLLIGLVYAFVSLPDKHKDIIQAKYVLFGFFLLSLLLNLPKKFILQQLQQLL
ncbi:hypothetical protein [Pontibacter indicus]|uniref:Dolichyl-phosphate-mannose-protein mannosyltransferase n=1 Tax=Pontibacter indicus TaxID=1317125 RepID=A0A1R3XBH5_9BACT|nr:hypothetical protein [Pontibacter indicus]SIT88492.1 hypothetical protein SAMN05444128_1851 [Pontibacter indicus]